jgi:hypothetical protein
MSQLDMHHNRSDRKVSTSEWRSAWVDRKKIIKKYETFICVRAVPPLKATVDRNPAGKQPHKDFAIGTEARQLR